MDLNELDFDNIGGWPLAVKVIFITLCCTVILVLSSWFIIKPQFKHWDLALDEKTELMQEFEQKYGYAANISTYLEQIKQIKSMFGTMLGKLPSRSEVPNLVEDISKLGIANGLDFELIKPEAEIERDFVTVMPIKIIVEGNYHQLAKFVSDISTLQRIVSFDDFTIKRESPNLQNPAPVGTDRLIMDIMAKTFRYQDPNDKETSPNAS